MSTSVNSWGGRTVNQLATNRQDSSTITGRSPADVGDTAEPTVPAIPARWEWRGRNAVPLPRIGHRRAVRVPGRLTWRDTSGALRFVSVVTRDVSDLDVFVECQMPASIPLYRLVHFQIERPARQCDALPTALQQGTVLSAVYRVGPYQPSTGTPQGYALRLLVDPVQAAVPSCNSTALAAAATAV
jgi:hypothetical protein